MRCFISMALIFLVCGCSIALSGQQSGSVTSTASSVRAPTHAGTTRLSGSFGTPEPASSTGGQASLSRGAALVVVLGLVIADFLQFLSSSASAAMPQGSIADTCSCYGYTPAPH